MGPAGRFACGAAAMLANAACSGTQYVQAIDYRAISAVEGEIKRQIGLYMAATALQPRIRNIHGDWITLPIGDATQFQCGKGLINFDIFNVKADLIVTSDKSVDGRISASIPVNAVTLGPSGDIGSETSNTQELIYNIWFDPIAQLRANGAGFLDQPVTDETMNEAPIARALLDLRNALVASGMATDPYTGIPRSPQPCHWDWNQDPGRPGGVPGDVVKFGISVSHARKIGLDVKITLVDLGLSAEQKSVTGNTITVSFYQAGTLDLKPRQEGPSHPPRAGKPGPISEMKPIRLAVNDGACPSQEEADKTCKIYGANSYECQRAQCIGENIMPRQTVPLPNENTGRSDQTAPENNTK